MSNQSLPDVLNVQPLPSIQTMNIETNQLDPIVINQGFCRFVLERKGILDVGSTFTFSVHPTDVAGDDKAFLPVKTGIHSLIKRAVLKVGTKVLATSDDYAFYQTIKRAFKTNEEKSQKDLVKVGSTDVMEPDNQGDGKYQMKSLVYSNAITGLIDPSLRLRISETECPVFSIKLSELFPMMKNVQLPLYLIGENVSVEITFNQQPSGTTGVLALFDDGYTNGTGIKIGTDNVKFLADYLTYENERMDATAKLVMSENGLVMPYEDLILTSSNIPALATAPVGTNVVPQSVVRDLGLSGRNVRSIVLHDHIQGHNPLVGVYGANGYNVPDAYNWRINDRLIYSRDIVNEARKQNQLSQVFSTNVNCLNVEYSNDLRTNKLVANQPTNQDIVKDNTCQGHEMKELQNQCHYEGVDLSVSPLNVAGAGMMVGQKPVEHIRTIYRTAENNNNRELRYFSLVERMLTLKSGQVMVSA
jgi:hypothetical protein